MEILRIFSFIPCTFLFCDFPFEASIGREVSPGAEQEQREQQLTPEMPANQAERYKTKTLFLTSVS